MPFVGMTDDKVQSGFGMRWFYNNPTQPNRRPTLNAMHHVTSGNIIADEGLTDVPRRLLDPPHGQRQRFCLLSVVGVESLHPKANLQLSRRTLITRGASAKISSAWRCVPRRP